ncbi:MAG: apolipoprotein N-acyltransferase [Pseudomonadota bacterium]
MFHAQSAHSAHALRLFGAFLLGAASVLAYAPFSCFPLIWLTLGGLFALLSKAHQGRQKIAAGALLGAAFGLGLFLGGVSWIYVSLNVFGGMSSPLAALATLLFCLLLALYPALCGGLFMRFAPDHRLASGLLFAALWGLNEWLRGWLFTGFPWLATGYAQSPGSPLAGFIPVLGVYGASMLCALLGACLYLAIQRTRWALALLCLVLLSGAYLSQQAWSHAVGKPFSVALLQGNIGQNLKWQPEQFSASLRTYYQLMLDHPAQLTVLPETALPALLEQIPADYLNELKRLALRQQGELLLGAVTQKHGEYSNSALSLGKAPTQYYDKSHLVPFGEFIPPGFAWFLRLAQIPMSDLSPGNERQPNLNLLGQKIALNICYEDVFGEALIRALPEAGILINLSNVAWFGDSLAPAQHLQIAQIRALETGRMMLRATNTGMTAIIGSDGRVQKALPSFTRAALLGEVQAFQGSTPFVRWGNLAALGLMFLLCVLCGRFRQHSEHTEQTQRLSKKHVI